MVAGKWQLTLKTIGLTSF